MRFCLSFFTLLVAFTSCKEQNEKVENPPNIILILADDLGYSDVSCYRERLNPIIGQMSTSQTPNIDQLAKEGIMFSDFYAGAAVCSPSRGALLTGRNCTRLGIYNWIPANSPMHLRSSEVTIPEMLKQQNYQTGHFGKWHLTSEGQEQPHPNDQGFDYSFYAYNNARPTHENPENYFRNGEAMGKMEGYACQIVADEALAWLTKADKSKPFYMSIWFNEPHEKVAAPDSIKNRHAYNQAYYGAIENMDLAVGKVMDHLKNNGLEENTIVIFTSDNGSQNVGSNEPLLGEKCFNFEGGIRVPFIAKWPNKILAGTYNTTPGSFTDVLPTLASFTKSKIPADRTLDGIDLSRVLLENPADFEREKPILFYRYFHEPVTMLRQGDWCLLGYENKIDKVENFNERDLAKLKPAPGKPRWDMWGFQPAHQDFIDSLEVKEFELYNLREDIAQAKDLSAEYPERLESMKKTMLQLKEEMIAEGGDWFEN